MADNADLLRFGSMKIVCMDVKTGKAVDISTTPPVQYEIVAMGVMETGGVIVLTYQVQAAKNPASWIPVP